MLKPGFKNSFKRDLKLLKKRGKNIEKLLNIMNALIHEKPLQRKHVDHPLKGDYVDCRECHVEPDWLLIYLIEDDTIIFIRTGTHSDLFK